MEKNSAALAESERLHPQYHQELMEAQELMKLLEIQEKPASISYQDQLDQQKTLDHPLYGKYNYSSRILIPVLVLLDMKKKLFAIDSQRKLTKLNKNVYYRILDSIL